MIVLGAYNFANTDKRELELTASPGVNQEALDMAAQQQANAFVKAIDFFRQTGLFGGVSIAHQMTTVTSPGNFSPNGIDAADAILQQGDPSSFNSTQQTYSLAGALAMSDYAVDGSISSGEIMVVPLEGVSPAVQDVSIRCQSNQDTGQFGCEYVPQG